MSETDVSRAIQQALIKLGLLVVRVHSGRVRVRGGYMQLAPNGTPDLWTSEGWIEVKRPGEKREPEQVKWHEEAARRGVNVGVADSVKSAVELVMGWRRKRAS